MDEVSMDLLGDRVFIAIKYDQLPVLKDILSSKLPINYSIPGDITFVNSAINYGRLEILEFLVEKGAQITDSDLDLASYRDEEFYNRVKQLKTK